MNSIFNLDNKFFRGVAKISDCVWVNILWLICSLPIFTSGAATTAMYYTINKCIRHERGYVTSEFFSSFKSEFKQATVLWFILFAIYALLGADYFIMQQYVQAGGAIGSLHFVFFAFALIVTMWSVYIFPYLARFENTVKNVLRNTLIIAVTKLHWTIIITVLFVAMLLGIYLLPPVVLVLPVIYNVIKNFILERVFKKYMTPEDLALEEERNRNFYH